VSGTLNGFQKGTHLLQVAGDLATPMASIQRIQIELPEDRVRELETLMEQTGTNTKKDLLNNALTLFEWAVNERRAGRIIASVDEHEKRYKEVVMPTLERAMHKSPAPAEAAKQ
jgi:hypothetical protein